MQSVVFRALVPAVQPLPRVSADDTLAPFQATRRDACRPRLPFLAGSALTDSLSSRSVWVFFSTQHRAVLGSWGNTPIHRHRLESDRWLWRVTRDFYSTLLHSRPPHSLSSHKAFQRFRLGTFHFQMLSLLFHLDSVLQEFSRCRGGEKGGKSRTKHTHTLQDYKGKLHSASFDSAHLTCVGGSLPVSCFFSCFSNLKANSHPHLVLQDSTLVLC